LIAITGFEITAVLAESLLGLFDRDDMILSAERLAVDLVPALLRAVVNTDHQMLELDIQAEPSIGWCAELIYGGETVDALSTAMALYQALTMSQLAAEMCSREALDSFDTVDTKQEYWPDWIVWSTYKKDSEPDSAVRILDWIDERLVQPRLNAKAPWARRDADIILMFGPPGTTKTTIVRSVAVGLAWPLVTLSPGDFIREGLDMIEAQATRIFERLHDINRAVVLFDEADELFRDRGQERALSRGDQDDTKEPLAEPAPADLGGDQRGIGAFVTASMLPKLQDLHDRSQVLVFVLTNFYWRLDPAIRRLGRIDYMIGVPPPDEIQREATVRRLLEKDSELKEHAAHAAAALAGETQLYNRPELVQAVHAMRGELREVVRAGKRLPQKKINEIAATVGEATRGRITMDEALLQQFNALAAEVSTPHTDPVRS
jgi:hypothetical protein